MTVDVGSWVEQRPLVGPFVARRLATGWWDVIDTNAGAVRAVFPSFEDASRHAAFLVRYHLGRDREDHLAGLSRRAGVRVVSRAVVRGSGPLHAERAEIRNMLVPVVLCLDHCEAALDPEYEDDDYERELVGDARAGVARILDVLAGLR